MQEHARISGPLTAPVTLRAGAATDIVGFRFRTAGAKTVLAPPLSELTDRVESLDVVAPRLARALYVAALRGRTPAARAAALSHVLNRFVARSPDALATAAIRLLDASEAPRVGLVADRFGVVARTLELKRDR